MTEHREHSSEDLAAVIEDARGVEQVIRGSFPPHPRGKPVPNAERIARLIEACERLQAENDELRAELSGLRNTT